MEKIVKIPIRKIKLTFVTFGFNQKDKKGNSLNGKYAVVSNDGSLDIDTKIKMEYGHYSRKFNSKQEMETFFAGEKLELVNK
jgi:hypothetical protein